MLVLCANYSQLRRNTLLSFVFTMVFGCVGIAMSISMLPYALIATFCTVALASLGYVGIVHRDGSPGAVLAYGLLAYAWLFLQIISGLLFIVASVLVCSKGTYSEKERTCAFWVTASSLVVGQAVCLAFSAILAVQLSRELTKPSSSWRRGSWFSSAAGFANNRDRRYMAAPRMNLSREQHTPMVVYANSRGGVYNEEILERESTAPSGLLDAMSAEASVSSSLSSSREENEENSEEEDQVGEDSYGGGCDKGGEAGKKQEEEGEGQWRGSGNHIDV